MIIFNKTKKVNKLVDDIFRRTNVNKKTWVFSFSLTGKEARKYKRETHLIGNCVYFRLKSMGYDVSIWSCSIGNSSIYLQREHDYIKFDMNIVPNND